MEISIFHINCETTFISVPQKKTTTTTTVISISAITALLYSMNLPSLLKPKKNTEPNRRPQEGKETQLLTL